MNLSHRNASFSFAEERDIPEILELFRRSYGRQMAEAYYRWQFLENPAGVFRSAVARIGERIVCHVGYSARRCRLAARDGLLHAKHTSMSHPDVRGRGIYSCLMLWAHQKLGREGSSLVLSWPNRTNHVVQLALETYRDIREVPVLKRAPAGVPRENVPSPFDSVAPQAFGPEYDALAAETVGSARFQLLRSAGYLRWRYAERPDVEYFIVENRRAGKLRSTVLAKPYPPERPDRLMVVEWLSAPGDPEATVPLESLEHYADERGLVVMTWHGIHDRFRRRLLEKRGYSISEPIVYFGAFPLVPEEQIPGYDDFRCWYTSMGDVDIF